MPTSKTGQLKLNDCGQHYGAGGPCAKCKYFAELRHGPQYAKYRAGLQYGGTPWIAVLGPPEPNVYIPHQDPELGRP